MVSTRNRLSVSALAAASSFIALTAPAQAQSVCSAVGTAVTCTPGTVTTTLGAGATLNSAVEGLSVAGTATLPLAISGTITTITALPALNVVTTAGDLTVTAGANGAVNLVTTGTGAGAVLSSPAGAVTATLGTVTTNGATGAQAAGFTGASLTTGAITATNVTSATIPVLGSWGAGAVATATTGPAVVTVNGALNVTGSAAMTSPVFGALTYAASGAATTTVNGAVTVSHSASAAVGAGAVGTTDATLAVTGPVSVTSTSLTDPAIGLYAIGGTGTTTVTCGGNVSASGPVAYGIYALGTAVSVACPNANVTATDTDTTGSMTDAVGVAAAATNALTVNVGKVVSSGDGIDVSTSGGTSAALNVTVKGVQAGLNGVVASATGLTPVTITATAPVTAAGGLGISGTAGDGLLTITEVGVNGSTGGVLATTTGTGSVIVNANGGTTTSVGGDAIQIVSGGSATTNVAAGATVTGQGLFDAIDTASAGASTNTVNIAGTVSGPATGTAVAVRAAGGPATINVNSGGALNGGLALTGGADTVNVNAGGIFRPTGTADFGAGTDALNVRSGGTLALTSTSAFSGLETLSNAGTTSLAGTVSLAGVTTFSNTGTLSATGGATVLTGLPTFTNTGTISMVDGAADDVLTLGSTGTPMNYVGGANARLAVDVNTAAGTADRLVVTGNTSGSTAIAPAFLGTVTYNPTGVIVATTAGTTASGAFTIDPGSVAQGFLNAGLTQTGGTTRVVTTLDSSVTDLALAGTFGRDMWYQSFDAYNDAVRGRHAGSLTTGQPIGIWGQLYRSRDKVGDSGLSVTTAAGNVLNYSTELKTDRGGAQVGLEYRGPGFVIGATGGYEWADSRDHATPALLTAEGHNWGVYGLVGMANGLYAGLVYKRDDHDVRFFNPSRGTAAYFNNAHSDGVDGEIGMKGDAGAIGFDVQAGLSYVKTHVGSYSAQGLDFAWDQNKSLRGRLGGRVIFPAAWGAYVGAKVYHEFKDDGVFRVLAGGTDVADIAMPHRGTWVRLEGGLDSFGIKGALLSVWGDIGDSKAIGGRVGFRF